MLCSLFCAAFFTSKTFTLCFYLKVKIIVIWSNWGLNVPEHDFISENHLIEDTHFPKRKRRCHWYHVLVFLESCVSHSTMKTNYIALTKSMHCLANFAMLLLSASMFGMNLKLIVISFFSRIL